MALSWGKLKELVGKVVVGDLVNGPTNSYTKLRLFGQPKESVKVTFYRDNHAWCPYCQKVWLWLEEKRVPYRVEKVTMFCYGEKEKWFKEIVPSGMLPALKLNNRLITESDVILQELEAEFGPLYIPMNDKRAIPLRKLERQLFRAWCSWLCYPQRTRTEERESREVFEHYVQVVEKALAATPGPYFLEEFSIIDTIFTPYVERMNASLYYYKGYELRGLSLADDNPHPRMSAWFDAMESRETYRGTQSDFHTHSHDLPPQMGGCYENNEEIQQMCKGLVDCGPFDKVPDVGGAPPEDARELALTRVIKHHETIMKQNPCTDKTALDEALRAALTLMMTGEKVEPPSGTEAGMRYIRDRINVPRDMNIHSARFLRQALEDTAAQLSDTQGPPIPERHRRDQDPRPFARARH